jgi:hypothetical protein
MILSRLDSVHILAVSYISSKLHTALQPAYSNCVLNIAALFSSLLQLFFMYLSCKQRNPTENAYPSEGFRMFSMHITNNVRAQNGETRVL